MDFLTDFIKTNLLQLLNLLVLTVFGAAGWKIVQESKKNLEERYKAELAKRDVDVASLKAEVEDWKRKSISGAVDTIEAYEKYAENLTFVQAKHIFGQS